MRAIGFGLCLLLMTPVAAGAASNTVVGAGSGVVAGALVAGPIGAVVGGVVGGVIGSNSERPVRKYRRTRRRTDAGPLPAIVAQAAASTPARSILAA